MEQAEFKQQVKAQGYDAAEVVEIDPNLNNESHSHEFSASLLVLNGEFTLVTEAGAKTHLPGDVCSLAAGTPHSEKSGADGATVLIAKK